MLSGAGGDDIIYGFEGDDTIIGGDGADRGDPGPGPGLGTEGIVLGAGGPGPGLGEGDGDQALEDARDRQEEDREVTRSDTATGRGETINRKNLFSRI